MPQLLIISHCFHAGEINSKLTGNLGFMLVHPSRQLAAHIFSRKLLASSSSSLVVSPHLQPSPLQLTHTNRRALQPPTRKTLCVAHLNLVWKQQLSSFKSSKQQESSLHRTSEGSGKRWKLRTDMSRRLVHRERPQPRPCHCYTYPHSSHTHPGMYAQPFTRRFRRRRRLRKTARNTSAGTRAL